MECFQKTKCVFHDQGSPAFHDVPDVDKAALANVRVAQAFVAKQDPDHQKRFCKHGKYVGASPRAALIHCCFCKQEGDLK